MSISVSIYLNFLGNTEEAFQFYRLVFGGNFSAVQRFGDTPMAGQYSDADKQKLMHIALPLGNGSFLMGTDAIESKAEKVTVGNNISISLHPDSRTEADRLFAGLSGGGDVQVAMAEQFWGDYFGMCTDRFGIQWMINCAAK